MTAYVPYVSRKGDSPVVEWVAVLYAQRTVCNSSAYLVLAVSSLLRIPRMMTLFAALAMPLALRVFYGGEALFDVDVSQVILEFLISELSTIVGYH